MSVTMSANVENIAKDADLAEIAKLERAAKIAELQAKIADAKARTAENVAIVAGKVAPMLSKVEQEVLTVEAQFKRNANTIKRKLGNDVVVAMLELNPELAHLLVKGK